MAGALVRVVVRGVVMAIRGVVMAIVVVRGVVVAIVVVVGSVDVLDASSQIRLHIGAELSCLRPPLLRLIQTVMTYFALSATTRLLLSA